MVVLEKKPDGNKHLHGIIQCLPDIGKIKYAFAFRDGFHDYKSMKGFVPEIEQTCKEIKRKTYITKYLELEGQPDPFDLDHDNQREEYEFDVLFSPNFPCWKHTEI
jgi:hypothetical protein